MSIERQQDRGHFGGGIGIREVAAQRAPVAHLWMGDVAHGRAEQGMLACQHGISFDAPVPGHGADPDAAVFGFPDAGKRGDAVEVDQHGGLDQTIIHCRHKALAAGQETGVVSVPGLQLESLLLALRGDVFEGRWLHLVDSSVGRR